MTQNRRWKIPSNKERGRTVGISGREGSSKLCRRAFGEGRANPTGSGDSKVWTCWAWLGSRGTQPRGGAVWPGQPGESGAMAGVGVVTASWTQAEERARRLQEGRAGADEEAVKGRPSRRGGSGCAEAVLSGGYGSRAPAVRPWVSGLPFPAWVPSAEERCFNPSGLLGGTNGAPCQARSTGISTR